MSGVVDVEPDTFRAASAVFGDTVAGQLGAALSGLQSGLAGTGAMAGSDPGGQAWAASYEQAANATVAAMTDLPRAAVNLALTLEATGFNHGMAESASDPSKRAPTPPDTTAYTVPAQSMCMRITAGGGSGDPPTGWGLISHLVGSVWPDGDPGKLRTAAHTWTTAARTLNNAATHVPDAVAAIRSQQSPEVDDAAMVCEGIGVHIDDTAECCRSLADACTSLAQHVEAAHNDIIDELVSLLEWTAAIEAGGAVAAFFTAGAAEIPAQTAEGARLTATAARIATIITRLTTAAGRLTDTIATVLTKINDIATKLARLTKAVARTSEAGHTTAQAAKGLDTAAHAEKTVLSAAKIPEELVDTRLPNLSPEIRDEVRQVIERSRVGKERFPGRDGKRFNNFNRSTGTNPLPPKPAGYYREWTAASQNVGKRAPDRVIIGGDPTNPDIIYYWDHGQGYTVIYP